jgi:hypothetical protein
MVVNSKKIILSGLITGIIASGLWSCAVKSVAVYDNSNIKDSIPHIENVYAINIFTDYISSELWKTENSACLQIKNVFDNTMIGEGGLYLKWNKTSGGCDWVGIGIGWDGWSAKNLQEIYNQASIQFMVRSPKGTQLGLPWAMAFEDYGGGQAWAGVFANFIEGGKITEQWTKVQIPLTAFDFSQFDADMTNIKQILIQFESEGEIYLDDWRIVPAQTVKTKAVEVPFALSNANVDGVKDELYSGSGFELENGKVWMAVNDSNLMVYAEVIDATPLQNKNTGKDIWNGDGIEIAFSTNINASKTRKALLLSDQHIGIKASASPTMWNWRLQQNATGNAISKQTAKGYVIEAVVPLNQFIAAPFAIGNTYSVEVAIDAGTNNKGREKQYRWNNPYNEGFHTSPQLWGQMLITNETVTK